MVNVEKSVQESVDALDRAIAKVVFNTLIAPPPTESPEDNKSFSDDLANFIEEQS